MEIAPQIFTAKVMHKRLFPQENEFSYGVYYLALPLPAAPLPGWLTRFDKSDLGYRDGRDPIDYAQEILSEYKSELAIEHIMLVTMPRVLGYVFNPVSFYLCLDKSQNLRAVIAEVHNTFGEQHTYLCARHDGAIISADKWLEAEKLFHVSPFLPREGHYCFRFDLHGDKLGIWINYFDKAHNKQLITALTGRLTPLTTVSLRRAFWSHPLVTIKTIGLIHWQAIKLFMKRAPFFTKPEQKAEKVSCTRNLTKS